MVERCWSETRETGEGRGLETGVRGETGGGLKEGGVWVENEGASRGSEPGEIHVGHV